MSVLVIKNTRVVRWGLINGQISVLGDDPRISAPQVMEAVRG